MRHPKDTLPCFGKLQCRFTFTDIAGEWIFYEDVFIRLQRREHHLTVTVVVGADNDAIYVFTFNQTIPFRHKDCRMFFGELGSCLFVSGGNRHDFGIFD